MAKFSDAIRLKKVGEEVLLPGPILADLPGVSGVNVVVVSRSANGLYCLRVTWHGIFLGYLHGKPGSSAGWSFNEKI